MLTRTDGITAQKVISAHLGHCSHTVKKQLLNRILSIENKCFKRDDYKDLDNYIIPVVWMGSNVLYFYNLKGKNQYLLSCWKNYLWFLELSQLGCHWHLRFNILVGARVLLLAGTIGLMCVMIRHKHVT
jgi:hypothetical protein